MNNIVTITVYTLQELIRRKLFIVFLAGIAFVWLIFFGLLSGSIPGAAAHAPAALQESMARQLIQSNILATILVVHNFGIWLLLFAGFPLFSLLTEKGSIELFLSKPISRGQFYGGRILGGILMGTALLYIFDIGLIVIPGLRFGFWEFSVLNTIFPLLLAITSQFAAIGFFSLLTRSPLIGVLATYLLFIFPPAAKMLKQMAPGSFITQFFSGAAYLVPDFKKINGSCYEQIIRHSGFGEFQPFFIAIIFCALMIAGSMYRFEKTDI